MNVITGLEPAGRTPWARIALIWLCIAVLMVLINWSNIAQGRFLDPDDTLRLVQVRDLVGGQGWFDLHQYRVDPGASPVMHWSRLVDTPLALAVLSFRPWFGQAMAEQVAVVIVPLLTLLALMAIVGRIAYRVFDREIAGLACLSLGFSPLLLAQFQPLRIDHHAWQVVSVMFAIGALMQRNPRIGGALAGIGIATGMSISLEVLPLAAIVGAVLLLRWLRDPAQRWWLAAYLAGLAAMLAIWFAATRGFADLTAHCDVVSPQHFGFFAVVALGAVAIASRPKVPPAGVVALLGAAGAAGLALFALTAPQCVAGPFGNLDPVVRQYWYANVLEGRPFWLQPADQVLAPLMQGVIALFVTLHLWRKAEGERRGWWGDYLLVFAGALVVGLTVWRSMIFVGALSAVPIAWLLHRLLHRFRTAERPLMRIAVGVAALFALLPATPVVMARLVLPAKVAGSDGQMRESSCELAQSALALNPLGKATIFAPVDIGPALIERTQDSVVATGHHRAQQGMRDVIVAFLGPQDQAHAIVRRHNARYLVLCTDLGEPQLYEAAAPHGFMAQLLHGKVPAWLQAVPVDAPPTFRVWKVVG